MCDCIKQLVTTVLRHLNTLLIIWSFVGNWTQVTTSTHSTPYFINSWLCHFYYNERYATTLLIIFFTHLRSWNKVQSIIYLSNRKKDLMKSHTCAFGLCKQMKMPLFYTTSIWPRHFNFVLVRLAFYIFCKLRSTTLMQWALHRIE